MERVGQHCASRHKKDFGINVRKCDYCVQNDTHSGPDHLSLDATLSGISLAPASSVSPRPLQENKAISAGAVPWVNAPCFARSGGGRARACPWNGLQETVDSPYLGMINCPEGGTGFNFSWSVNRVPLFPPHTPWQSHILLAHWLFAAIGIFTFPPPPKKGSFRHLSAAKTTSTSTNCKEQHTAKVEQLQLHKSLRNCDQVQETKILRKPLCCSLGQGGEGAFL